MGGVESNAHVGKLTLNIKTFCWINHGEESYPGLKIWRDDEPFQNLIEYEYNDALWILRLWIFDDCQNFAHLKHEGFKREMYSGWCQPSKAYTVGQKAARGEMTKGARTSVVIVRIRVLGSKIPLWFPATWRRLRILNGHGFVSDLDDPDRTDNIFWSSARH